MSLDCIGKRIRQYRMANHWKQEVFAEKVGLSVSYVGMVERGEKTPKMETFIRIANVLGVSSDALLADVLENGYVIKTSQYTDKIGKLTKDEQQRIYDVLDTLLKNT